MISTGYFPGPGFIIEPRRPQSVTEAEILRIKSFETPNISDYMNGMYSLDKDIRNITNHHGFSGPALTVKLPGGDNLMLHRALEMIIPGDILVISCFNNPSHAVCGEMVATKARHRGAAAIVVDGNIRDSEGLRLLDIPILAKGITPSGPTKNGPGEINTPISCGGVVVRQGDIVVGDTEGTVVIPNDYFETVLQQLISSRSELVKYEAKVREGDFELSWARHKLAKLGLKDPDCP